MGDRTTESLGMRIKELRQEAQLSQRGLADVLHRSVSWVSQVERDEIEVTDVTMLQRLAAALGVPSRELVEVVLGDEAAHKERQRSYVELLRLALAGHPAPEIVLGSRPTRPVDLSWDTLQHRVEEAWQLVHRSAYEELGPLLADLVLDLELASRQVNHQAQRLAVFVLLADAYQVAAAMLVKTGDAGAAWIAADRAITAGERCGDRALVIAGHLRMAHTFVDSSERDLALHVLHGAVGLAPDLSAESEPGLVSLTGACALLLAVLEARADHAADARRHLRVAQRLAAYIGGNRNDYGTEFGPTNVVLHQVAVAVELGNAAEALDIASDVHIADLLPERQARFLVDVARAHAQRHAVEEAVAALTRAEQIAPGEIRELRRIRGLLSDLEHQAGRRRVPGLRSLRHAVSHN